jgi:PAS domain S-box-containing protein
MSAPLGSRDRTLQASAASFRGLFERAPIGLVQVDAQGHILAANAAVQRILGYSEDEFRQLNVGEVTHPDDRALGWALFADVLAGTSDSYTMDKRYLHKDGRIVWGQLSVSATRDEEGNLTSIVAMVVDMTEQKRTELALEQARMAAEELATIRLQQAEEVLAMAAVGAALASTLDPGTIYQVILAQAARILPFNNSIIVFYRDGWVIVGATLGGPDIAPGTPMMEVDTGTSAWRVLRRGQPLLLADTAAVPDWVDPAPWRGPYRVRSAIIVPMLVDGELIGSFQVNSYTTHFFAERHVPIAAAFGERAAQALRNSRLFAAEQERARIAEELAGFRQQQATEAEALGAVGAALASTLEPVQLYQVILEQSARILPCDHAGVTLYAKGQATFFATWGEPRIQPGFSWPMPELWLPDDVGGVSYLPDADTDPTWFAIPPLVGPYRARSVLSAPLTVDGIVAGSFWVSSRIPDFYTARHQRLAAVLADQATQALRNANLYEAEQRRRRAAEDYAQLQSDFIASVSHELRTPLTAIVGFAELLQARWKHLTDTHRLQRIDYIVLAANRQRRLVEDLLLVSRMNAMQLAPKLVALPMHALVQQAVAEVQASYPGQRIVVQGPSELLVRVDSGFATQALANLLDNAAKYSPEGSSITVSWVPEGLAAVVRVMDQGAGVPEAGRGQLFTRFGRLPGSRIRAGRVGTGLGLYISRGLAEAMGGTLDLEATGPDGSTFRLCVPSAPDQSAFGEVESAPE